MGLLGKIFFVKVRGLISASGRHDLAGPPEFGLQILLHKTIFSNSRKKNHILKTLQTILGDGP